MRFSLRTLLIVLAIGPMVLAGLSFAPHWLPLAAEPGLFMLAGALAMAALGFVLNATEAIAKPMFRFQVRDMLWLAVVLLILGVLWENNRHLNAARLQAYNLRQALRHAFHYYHPDKQRPAYSDVDWKLTDEPIP